MSSFDDLAARYRAAREQGTQHELDAVLDEVPEHQLDAFLDHLEAVIPVPAPTFDHGELERQLVARGMRQDDAASIAQESFASFAEVLGSRMHQHGVDVDELALRVMGELERLDGAAQPRIARYLRRLLDGRHDPRRVAPAAVAALARAVGCSSSVLDHARTRSSLAGTSLAPAAARGDADGLGLLPAASADDDEVARLFDAGPPPAEGPDSH